MIETGVVEAVFGDHEAVLLVVGMHLFLLYHDYHLFLFLFLFRRRLCQFQFLEVVHELAQRGYTPLLAHVERYHWLRGEEGDEILEDLRAAGARFQVNRTVGKVNVPGVGSRGKFIVKLRRRGWIDEVGSDLHRPTPEGRPYAMGIPH